MTDRVPVDHDVVVIHTDGGCRPNPGPGGWGALLVFGDHEKELFGGEADTTNNRMELTAVIHALESLTRACSVALKASSSTLSVPRIQSTRS